MLALVLTIGLGLALVAMAAPVLVGADRNRFLGIVLVGFLVRPLFFVTVMRSVSFFSHGHLGGDSIHYQMLGSEIVHRWHLDGVAFVTSSEMPRIGSVALPCNVLALLEFVAGEPQPLAGTVVNAFFACWMVIILAQFLRDRDVAPRPILWFALVTTFSPAFVFHTSDTYKDGINAFLVLTSLTLSIRLAGRLEASRVVQLALCLWALWFVRHYMVFMCVMPLMFGILGSESASRRRRWAAGAFLLLAFVGAYWTGSADSVVANAESTFEYATSDAVLTYNATGRRAGSGVVTDSIVERLLYTMFAPFPWQSGSIGFNLGKIEAFIAYGYVYMLYRNRRVLWTTRRTELLMIAMLVVPGVVAYAMTMSNVGLIVRQRLPLIIALGVLAVIGHQAAIAAAPVAPSSPQVSAPYRRGRRAARGSRELSFGTRARGRARRSCSCASRWGQRSISPRSERTWTSSPKKRCP